MRIAVYTAITGNYDSLRDHRNSVNTDIDFICFTDNPNISYNDKGWIIKQIPNDLLCLPKVKQQRLIKILPHRYLKEYDISLWIDGNISILCDADEFIHNLDLDEYHFFVKKHPSRDCIYKEADSVISYNKDTPDIVYNQTEKYRNEGMPEHFGLAETSIIIRKHNETDCQILDNIWARELTYNSHRDQLSFDYARWKSGISVGYFKLERLTQDKNFRWSKHGNISSQNLNFSITVDEFFKNSNVITINNQRLANFISSFGKFGNLISVFRGSVNKFLSGPQNCLASHVQLVKNAKLQNRKFTVIFEDDAIPRIEIEKDLPEYLENIPSDADLILLGWSSVNDKKSNQKFNNTINKLQAIFAGSHAYILFNKAFDRYINLASRPNTTADGFIFNNIGRSYVVDYPLFIQKNTGRSMNDHIGYILDGDHDKPPYKFGNARNIYIFSNVNPYHTDEEYAESLSKFDYGENPVFVFMNMAIPYNTNRNFFNESGEKIIFHRGAFNRDTSQWKQYFGEDEIRPYLNNFKSQYLINYELQFRKNTVVNADNGNIIDYYFNDMHGYPKNQTPTTGFLTYFIIKNMFKDDHVYLVNYLGKQDNSTPKAKCHEWNYEYDFFENRKYLKINI